MCGFVVAISAKGNKPDPQVLNEMAATISHRGPDDQGMWHDDSVAMHHKRLSIIDLEHGQQPMHKGDVSIVFNGEIYNYVELREELQGLGMRFSTTSDTEVLLQAYRQWQLEFLDKLVGMFSFVLYDSGRRRVIAARDHFGIKPLYRFEGRDCLLYASEVKALLKHPDVVAKLDPVAIEDYVTFQYTLGEKTLFNGVSKILPAHVEITDLASDMSTKSHCYWQPSYAANESAREADVIDELQALIENCVRMQLRSDVPVGAYLSGGLDSSTVSTLAAKHCDAGIDTFCGAFRDGPEYDETEYAALVAKSIDSTLHTIYPTEKDFIDLLPKLVYAMDEPAAGPGLFPQYMVSQLASQHVKVCLGGQGGDEVFGGYARYPIAYFEQLIRSAIDGDDSSLAAEGIRLEQFAEQLPALKQYKPMLARFFANGMFEPFERRYFSLVDRSEGSLATYSADFRQRFSLDRVYDRYCDWFARPDTDSYWNRMLHFDLTSSLPALLQVEDRVSMAVSLESRVPLLDHRITEFVAQLPPSLKWRAGEMKYLFKRAISSWLPDKIVSRRDKMGFPVPLQTWARGSARDFFGDVLLSQKSRERGLYDIRGVENLIMKEAAFGRGLWGVLQVELWHQQFVDQA